MSTDPRISLSFSGILNIHKRAGVTSREVVNDIQRKIRAAAGQPVKCGHAGTLDPMATGVLLICSGMATRLVPYLHEFPKTYRAGFTLGSISDTDDCWGDIQRQEVSEIPTRSQLQDALDNQTGSILQRPPAYSALKVAGQRAYNIARKGMISELSPRPTLIHEICLARYEFPLIECTIRCATGTYIRSVARDVGESLGCGGLMHSLVRTEIGPFSLAEARDLDSVNSDNVQDKLQSPASAFPGVERITINRQQREKLRDGIPVTFAVTSSHRLVAIDHDQSFLALLERMDPNVENYRARINFVPILFGK